MRIIVPGNPIPKARHRDGKNGHKYNPQRKEERDWLMLARRQITEKLSQGTPVSLYATFFMQRPESHFGTGRNAGKLKPSAPAHHVIKPDLDNLLKFVKDVLNGVAWHDDSQVVWTSMSKVYSDDNNPRTLLDISAVNP